MIKKLILLLLSFAAVLFTYSTYDFYNRKNISILDTFEAQIGYQEQTETYPMSVLFRDGEVIDDFLALITSYADEHSIPMLLITNGNEDGKERLTYAIYSDSEGIVDSLKIQDKKEIDFHDTESASYYASSDLDTNSSGLLTSLDRKYFDTNTRSYRIGTIASVKEDLASSLGATFCLYSNDTKAIQTDMDNLLANPQLQGKVTISSLYEGYSPADSKSINEGENEEVIWILAACIALVLLLLMIDISKKQKDILVMRMHGCTIFRVINKLYVKFLLVSFTLFLFVLGVLSLLMTYQVMEYATEFYLSISEIPLFLLLCEVFVYLLLYFYIKFTVDVTLLKKQQDHHQMLYVNLTMKVVILIFVLPSLISVIADASISFHDNYIISKYSSDLQNYVTFFPSYHMKMQDEMNVFDYFMKHDGEYIDMTKYIYSQRSFLEEQTTDENEIEASVLEFPFIYANANYLDHYEIYGIDGQRIDVHGIEEETLLVPMKYKDEKLKRVCYSTDCEVLYIEDPGDFLNYDVNTIQLLSTIHDPVIRVITHLGDESNRNFMFLPVSENKGISQYKEEIEKLSFPEISFASHKEGMRVWMERNKITCVKSGVSLMMYGLLLMVMIYQFVYLCISDMRREIILQYLAGRSFFYRMRYVFVISIVPYCIPFFVGITLQHLPISKVAFLMIVLAILEMLLTFAMVKKWEKTDAVQVLKGESGL